MRKYLYKFLRLLLVVATCIVALLITSSRIWSQCIDISEVKKVHKYCPTAEGVIASWYGTNPLIANSPLKGINAELPFDTIQFIGNCLDNVTGNNWCACTGADCLSQSANDRLSVQLIKDTTHVINPFTWRIKFSKPVKIVYDKSSCYAHPSTNFLNSYFKFSMNKGFPLKGSFLSSAAMLEFKMPPLNSIFPGEQICMLEIKMGNEIYHEHFATNDDCYGWIELKVIP